MNFIDYISLNISNSNIKNFNYVAKVTVHRKSIHYYCILYFLKSEKIERLQKISVDQFEKKRVK